MVAKIVTLSLGLSALDSVLLANPTGGSVTAGSATICTTPGTVTINQCSNLAIINWQTFSIAAGETTKFVQPSSSSAALNRVLGGGTSMIDGSLQANGQIIIINGNGIVIGPGGAVNTNSFIASTRDIDDNDFLNGNLHFTGNGSGTVQNSGSITAQSGDVVLIGKAVDNEGTISAPNGTVGLAGADDVLLNQCGTQHVFVSPSSAATSAKSLTAVTNGGTISAAQAELAAANGNMYALAINNSGTIRANAVSQIGGRIFLTTDTGMVQNLGTLFAKSCGNGGTVQFSGGSVWNRKTIDVSGTTGGTVKINAANVQNDGLIAASGTRGCGGTVSVTYSGNALASITGTIVVSGRSMGGSIDFLGTGATSESYLSMDMNASSSCGQGGHIMVDSASVYLAGAALNANGAGGNGAIYIGTPDPVLGSIPVLAQTLYIGLGTTITASATSHGNGGMIIAKGTTTSTSFGTVTATGRGDGSQAGSIIVPPTPVAPPVVTSTSGASSVSGSGSTAKGGPAFSFTDPDPGPNNAFGRPVTGLFNLPTDTTLITSPGDSFNAAGSGAAYLFSDKNGALLSTIRGTTASDGVGTTVQILPGNTFAIETPNWNDGTGAITFGTDLHGFAHGGGNISAANSLIGANFGDQVGSGGLVALGNGDYLVLSPAYNTGGGAVTWVDPALGLQGLVSSSNSLVGAAAGDGIGTGGIVSLANGTNYLVLSPNWDGGRGAVTDASNSAAIVGIVTSSNSLVGASTTDGVGGSGSIIDTPYNYYLVQTPNWGDGAGAVTWNASNAGTTGTVGSANSIVGWSSSDHIGSGGITLLAESHNYVVDSPDWNNNAGAVTLGVSYQSTNEVVGSGNSLVGAASGDEAGSGGIQSIYGGGAYLVLSPNFNKRAGAVSLVNDVNGLDGALSSSNSLVGAASGDDIGSGGSTVLSNNDVVVLSPQFDNGAGAVTWMPVPNDVGVPVAGAVSSSNSLVGSSSGDHVGSGGILQLANGNNFLVLSPDWDGGKGAITNGDSTNGITGIVGATTSLVGASAGDAVGSPGRVTQSEYSYQNYYLVTTPNFAGGAGAVTWNSDVGGTVGAISSSNSLVGSARTDNVGSGGIFFLGDNYLVLSPNWNSSAGAVTFGSSTGGLGGTVGFGNSLVGANAGDQIGVGGIHLLNNGDAGADYVVLSPAFNNGAGAVTFASSSTGISGTVGSTNSLVGAQSGDHIGGGGIVPMEFSCLVLSPDFDHGAGAVTPSAIGSFGTFATGIVSASNSLVGTESGDAVGAPGSIVTSEYDDYLVLTPNWGGGAGAVTFSSGDPRFFNTGVISASNSLVGSSSTDHIGSGGVKELGSGFAIVSPDWNNGTGAVTFSLTGLTGVVSAANSVVGDNPGDHVGSGGVYSSTFGEMILSPQFDDDAGAITMALPYYDGVNSAEFTHGAVSSANSLVGANIGDQIGSGGVVQVGQYDMVLSPNFDGGAGAITPYYYGDEGAFTPPTGVIGGSNSLVGANAGDGVGSGAEDFLLESGYYLVITPNFGGGAGAVTWNSYNNPTTGLISGSNSLVGSAPGDRVGSGGITFLSNEFPSDGNLGYVVSSPEWNGGAGAVTYGSGATGVSGVVGAANSLVGAEAGDHVGSEGLVQLANNNYLVLSPDFNGNAGAVTFGSLTKGLTGAVGASNSLVGAVGGDQIGDGGIAQLSDGNYLVLSPDFGGGAGAVTFGSGTNGVSGTVGASNSLVGLQSGDHVGSGGIIFLSNGNYLVQSPDFSGSAGAVTWGSATAGIRGVVSVANSIIGGGPDSGEEYAGESADGSVYFVTFTSDTSAGGLGRVTGGSTAGYTYIPRPVVGPEDFFLLQSVETVEASGFNFIAGDMAYYVSDPDAPQHGTTTNVDALSGGAVNSGHGKNLASGSSTATAPGRQRLVTPGNGVWNIFGGVVHSAPPPQWISQQLQLTLSPEVYDHLNEILFGSH